MNIKAKLERSTPKLYKHIVKEKYFFDYRKNKNFVLENGPEALVREMYTKFYGKEPNLIDPRTFNEKIQWLKLNWYDKRAQICSNKHTVREYVKSKGLDKLLIEQYGVYESAEDIDFSKLPNKFVLRPSHDSGHIIICRDKGAINIRKTRYDLKRWLAVDYEYMSGEWPYHFEKSIVCDKLMEDETFGELIDYKFFCFNGEPRYVFLVSDRPHHAKSDFYDMDWEKQDFRWYYEPSGKTFPRPKNFNLMKKYAKELASDFPFVRVDLYEINRELYFGELTFFHGGGLGWFKPEIKDAELGDMLVLPIKSKVSPWEIIHPELKPKLKQ